jgi:hypothetical protein
MTENDIQGLKAQEAKDLAIGLLKKLQAKDKAPISAGEVQVKELQYELRLREAEAEDNREREAHELRIAELQRQIEQERTRQAEAETRAEKVRAEHARLLQQVQVAEESLSIQLERATREHNLKVEQLESAYAAKADQLKAEQADMERQRDALRTEISELAELSELATEIGGLRDNLESRRHASQQELQQLDEEYAAAEFEKSKKINQIKRQQELDIAELDAQHQKNVLQTNRKAAERILADLGMVAVSQDQWQQAQQSVEQREQWGQQQLEETREKAKQEVLKAYNITSAETIDVTDLYYRHQAVTREAEALGQQVEKLDAEIRRMREHIEREPQRIAAAVEAAKVHVQNTIEQSGNRR